MLPMMDIFSYILKAHDTNFSKFQKRFHLLTIQING